MVDSDILPEMAGDKYVLNGKLWAIEERDFGEVIQDSFFKTNVPSFGKRMKLLNLL